MFSFIKIVGKFLLNFVAHTVNLWAFWSLLSGREGKKEARNARLLLLICFLVCAAVGLRGWLAQIMADTGVWIRFLVICIIAVLLFQVINYIFFYMGEKAEGKDRIPETLKKYKSTNRKRNKGKRGKHK